MSHTGTAHPFHMWTKFGDDRSKRSWVMLDKTDRLTDRQTDWQTDRQTDKRTYLPKCKFWQVIIYSISVMTITITIIIILGNFGKYAISDCPFITCQNLQFLASMFVCRFVTCQNFEEICKYVRLSVCLSVSLSVLSSITHERFDISSPNLVHIWNGSAVPVCDIEK